MSERALGVKVFPLAEEVYEAGYTSPYANQYALGINPHNGETFLIHSQGVSYQVTHDKPWRFNDYSLDSPWYTLKQVREFATEAPMELATWIDVFGARLESNFHLAYLVLTNEKPKDTEYNAAVYNLLGSTVRA